MAALQAQGYVVHLLIIDVSIAQSALGCKGRAIRTHRPLLDQNTFHKTKIMCDILRTVVNGSVVRVDNEEYRWKKAV